jgi:hypothetical protein
MERNDEADFRCALGPNGSRGRVRGAMGGDVCASGMVEMVGAGYLCYGYRMLCMCVCVCELVIALQRTRCL